MVSFQCERCGDVMSATEIDSHRGECEFPVTCTNCMSTFHGMDYRHHTSCTNDPVGDEDQACFDHLPDASRYDDEIAFMTSSTQGAGKQSLPVFRSETPSVPDTINQALVTSGTLTDTDKTTVPQAEEPSTISKSIKGNAEAGEATDVPRQSIPDLVRRAFNLFESVIMKSRGSATTSVSSSHWIDERGKFRMWAGNVGAHQQGTASLAYRLRQAGHILSLFGETLMELLEALEMAEKELSQESDITITAESDREPVTQRHNSIASDDAGTETGDIDQDQFYLETIYDDVVDYVQGLFRMTMLIRQPSRRDQILRRPEAEAYRQFDMDHVRHKFPQAEDYLISRLGMANSQRRANINYLKRHHDKLSVGLDKNDTEDLALSETQATELRFDDLNRFSAGTGVKESDNASVTSYGSSIVENKSRLPQRPHTTSIDDPFECPICFFLVKAPTTAAWLKHVFSDLQPYVCLNRRCQQPNTAFDSRREWFAHQTNCKAQASGMEDPHNCLMCHDNLTASNRERHLAKHLQDLALFVLPSSLLGDDENDTDAEEASSKNSDPIANNDQAEGRLNVTDAPTQLQDYIVQTVSEQGPWAGWQAEVLPQERTILVRQIVDSLRLLRPPVEIQRNVEVALHYERREFTSQPTKQDYQRECADKLSKLRDLRRQQLADSSDDASPTDQNVQGAKSQIPRSQEVKSDLTKEDNSIINQRAAELAKRTSKDQMRTIVKHMDPRLRLDLSQKGIDPIIYHFKMLAVREFRVQQYQRDLIDWEAQTQREAEQDVKTQEEEKVDKVEQFPMARRWSEQQGQDHEASDNAMLERQERLIEEEALRKKISWEKLSQPVGMSADGRHKVDSTGIVASGDSNRMLEQDPGRRDNGTNDASEESLLVQLEEVKKKEDEALGRSVEYGKKEEEEFLRRLEDQHRKEEKEALRRQDEYKRKLEEAKRKEEARRANILELAEIEAERYERERGQVDKDERESIRKELMEREKREKRRLEQERLEEQQEALRMIAEYEGAKTTRDMEEKALRERILLEEEERQERETQKKKEEEEGRKERARRIFAKYNLSEATELESIFQTHGPEPLDNAKDKRPEKDDHHYSSSRPRSIPPLDFERPAWIRIACKHILPETLDYYQFNWSYDPDNDHFVIIKQDIDRDLQREMFAHTKRLLRYPKLITEGYTKETVTTSRPDVRVVKNKNDQMFIVRKKSKSPATNRQKIVGSFEYEENMVPKIMTDNVAVAQEHPNVESASSSTIPPSPIIVGTPPDRSPSRGAPQNDSTPGSTTPRRTWSGNLVLNVADNTE